MARKKQSQKKSISASTDSIKIMNLALRTNYANTSIDGKNASYPDRLVIQPADREWDSDDYDKGRLESKAYRYSKIKFRVENTRSTSSTFKVYVRYKIQLRKNGEYVYGIHNLADPNFYKFVIVDGNTTKSGIISLAICCHHDNTIDNRIWLYTDKECTEKYIEDSEHKWLQPGDKVESFQLITINQDTSKKCESNTVSFQHGIWINKGNYFTNYTPDLSKILSYNKNTKQWDITLKAYNYDKDLFNENDYEYTDLWDKGNAITGIKKHTHTGRKFLLSYQDPGDTGQTKANFAGFSNGEVEGTYNTSGDTHEYSYSFSLTADEAKPGRTFLIQAGDGLTGNENSMATTGFTFSFYWAVPAEPNIWVYDNGWQLGLPWVYNGDEWVKAKNVYVFDGISWKPVPLT